MSSDIDYDKLAVAVATALSKVFLPSGLERKSVAVETRGVVGDGGGREVGVDGVVAAQSAGVDKELGVAATLGESMSAGVGEGAKASGGDGGEVGDVVVVQVAGVDEDPKVFAAMGESTVATEAVDGQAAWSECDLGGGSSATEGSDGLSRGGSSEREGSVVLSNSPEIMPSGPRVEASAFMRTYVRVGPVRELRELLSKMCGHKVPTSCMGDLALARYTAATVPDAFRDGRSRLKALAIVGDAAAGLAYTVRSYRLGGNAEAVQAVKRCLTDAVMSRAFAASKLASYVVVAGGVSLAGSKTGATALEAIAGVLSMYCGQDAVLKYLVAMRLERYMGEE